MKAPRYMESSDSTRKRTTRSRIKARTRVDGARKRIVRRECFSVLRSTVKLYPMMMLMIGTVMRDAV